GDLGRLAKRGRLANQDQEGGLEGVLGVLVGAEDAAANAPDHGAMPLHQGGKGCLFPAGDVALEQLPVRQVRLGQASPAEVLNDAAELAGSHRIPPSVAGSMYYYRKGAELIGDFLASRVAARFAK